MTKEEIVDAAFRAWTREEYKKMSLSGVAETLGVTKPALYRHFADKDALVAAMREAFFDRYAAALRTRRPTDGRLGRTFDFIEPLVRYFGARVDDLAFFFNVILRDPVPEDTIRAALAVRGIGEASADIVVQPSARFLEVRMVAGTCFLGVALFHLARKKAGTVSEQAPSEDDISRLTESILDICEGGLRLRDFDPSIVDYAALDRIARVEPEEARDRDGVLPAVASVVAESGSWSASMEMVAKKSGLSKSGLYAHFKSKEDMLSRMFLNEFERIAALIADRDARAEDPAERLYLAIATASGYLAARPDVLAALDWLRTQRIGHRNLMPEATIRAFQFLDDAARSGRLRLLPDGLPMTIRWILFLTVNLLMREKAAPGPVLRNLHGFLLGGLAASGKVENDAV